MTGMIVAVDGPAGSGKSSVSRAVAERLGFGYLDTGAAYRAFAWWVSSSELAPLAALAGFEYRVRLDPNDQQVTVGQVDVTAQIRDQRVSATVSSVAKLPEVRAQLTALFRDAVGAAIAAGAAGAVPQFRGVLVEGRDITTVVFPGAPVRLLLTASAEVRAARRGLELQVEPAQTAQQLRERDSADLAVVDFMNAAPGVRVIDSTDLNFEQTVDAVITVIRAAAVEE